MIPGLWSCSRIALLLQKHIPLVSRKGLIIKIYEHAGNSQPAQTGKLRQTRSKQKSAPADRQHSLTCSQQPHPLTRMSARKCNCLQPGNKDWAWTPHPGVRVCNPGLHEGHRLFCPQFSHPGFLLTLHSWATSIATKCSVWKLFFFHCNNVDF